MLQQIASKNSAKKQELKQTIAQLESSASTAAAACAGLLVDDLNEEVKQVHDTQKLLERESQLLQQELATLTSELSGWSVKTQELLEALKHVGDIEHYVAVLKREAAALDRVLGQLPTSQAAAPPAQHPTAAADGSSTGQEPGATTAAASSPETAGGSEQCGPAAGSNQERQGLEGEQHQQQQRAEPQAQSAASVPLPVSSRASR